MLLWRPISNLNAICIPCIKAQNWLRGPPHFLGFYLKYTVYRVFVFLIVFVLVPAEVLLLLRPNFLMGISKTFILSHLFLLAFLLYKNKNE